MALSHYRLPGFLVKELEGEGQSDENSRHGVGSWARLIDSLSSLSGTEKIEPWVMKEVMATEDDRPGLPGAGLPWFYPHVLM